MVNLHHDSQARVWLDLTAWRRYQTRGMRLGGSVGNTLVQEIQVGLPGMVALGFDTFSVDSGGLRKVHWGSGQRCVKDVSCEQVWF